MTIDDTGLITSTTFTGSGGERSTNDEGNTVVNGGGGGERSTCDAFPSGCDFDDRNAIRERGAGDNS